MSEESVSGVTQVVPFFLVTDIDRSLRFYVDGLGFVMANRWIVDGKLRWCWLTLDGASLMLQEVRAGQVPAERRGAGVSLNFICGDAIAFYHRFVERGLSPKTPFVGNGMWVTKVIDPDGYDLYFESPTTDPEETVYASS